MKKIVLSFILAVSIANLFATPYYWIGGATGNWSDGTKWSLSPGGGAANAVPGTTDDATFDTNSGTPTVTLTAATAVNTLTVSTGTTVTLTGSVSLTINVALTFTNNTVLASLPTTNGQGITFGNGTANFTLTGNSSSSYFDGNGNTYFVFNIPNSNPTAITPFFNPNFTTVYTSTGGFGSITVTKGLITLGNNVTTSRIILSSNNSQQLILGANTAITVTGNGSSQFSGLSTGGVVDASAPGSKFIVTSQNGTILNPLGRVFKPNTVINYFEMNKSTYNFIPSAPMTVNNLVLTAGNIYNSTNNNITVTNGGTITRTAGKLLIPPVYGTTPTDMVNLTIAGNCTADNEILGTVGKIGTLTINSGITYTVFNLATAPGYYLSAFNGGIGYSAVQTPTISAPASGTAPTLATAVNYGYLNTITTTPGTGLYTTAPTITIPAPSVNAWVASTAYTLNTVVSNGSAPNYYVCTTAGTSGASAGPSTLSNATSPSKDAITDNTAKWAYLGTSLVTATAVTTMLPVSIVVNSLTNNGTLTDANTTKVITVNSTTPNNTIRISDSNLIFSGSDGNLTIAGLNTGSVVSVYRPNGQLMKTFTANSSKSITALQQGIYIVKVVNTASNYSVSKVIVE